MDAMTISTAANARWEKGRFVPLDALRGMAAYLVVLQHSLGIAALWWPQSPFGRIVDVICTKYGDLGRTGVVAFFLTSGFVVPFSFKSNRPIRYFLLSRFFRLYPAYWVSIAAALILSVMVTHETFSVKQVLVNITMMQTWLRQPDVIGVYWTLAIEQIFYILCIAVFLFRLLDSPVYASLASVGFGLVAILFGALHFFGGRDLPTAIPLSLAAMHLGMLARMATIEGNQQANRLLRQVAFTSLILALLACFLNYPSMPIEKKSTWMAQCTSYIAGYGAFFAFLFFARGRWTERLSFMGAISYSIYLMHEPVQRLFQNTLPMDEPFWGGVYLLAALILPIPVSWIVYQLVERPSVRFGHKVANVKKPEGLRLA